jgi:hypothetical protein
MTTEKNPYPGGVEVIRVSSRSTRASSAPAVYQASSSGASAGNSTTFNLETGTCSDNPSCHFQAPLRTALLQMHRDLGEDPSIADKFKILLDGDNVEFGQTIWEYTTKNDDHLRWIYETGKKGAQGLESYWFMLIVERDSGGCGIFSWCSWGSKEHIVVPVMQVCIPTETEDLAKKLRGELVAYLCTLADACVICGEGMKQLSEDQDALPYT